jgi:fibronectin-binding autotransporter adhesin
MYLTPNSGGGVRFTIKDINLSEQSIQSSSPLPTNAWVHVAVTVNGSTAILYTNGIQAASGSVTYKPSDFKPRINTLGRCSTNVSPNTVPFFKGCIDDVFIADNALSSGAIAELVTNKPPQFVTNFIDGGAATQGIAYNGNLSGTATDDDGQAPGYSKVTGPAWLSVASNGSLTGTPTAADGGTNFFTVTATDSNGGGPGQHSYAVVQIVVASTGNSNSSVWSLDGNANWGTGSAWTNGDPPSGAGQTADFSAVDITANRMVTLEASRTIGNLMFSDFSGSQSWTIAAAGTSTLTLDSGSSAFPTIDVTNPVTISSPITGTNGFTKNGAGTLSLTGNNLYLSGNVVVAQGAVTVANGYALGTGLLTMAGGAISNTTGSYTLDNQINLASVGTFGVASGANLTLTGVITNSGGLTKEGAGTLMLAGANSFTGNTLLNAGTLRISSDGSTPLGYSTLVINGGSLDNIVIRNYGMAANNRQIWNGDFSFIGTQDLDMGAGTVTVNGSRQVTVNANTFQLDGVVSGSGSIIKSGTGILYLSGTGTYSGGTTLNAGELQIANSQALGSGQLTFNGGTFTARLGNRTSANAVAVGGNFTLNGTNAGANVLTLSGNVNLGGGIRTLTVDATPNGAIISGPISNGGLSKAGAGPLTLSTVNSYSGDTRVGSGTLKLANSFALQNSTLDLDSSDAGSLSFGSLTSATFGGLKGSRDLILLNASSLPVSLTFGGNGQNSIYSGSMSSEGNLMKMGAGTLTLSGANILTGPTKVNAGTLFINGSTGAGTLIVASGGTLGGIGNIGGPVTVQSGGIIAPGSDTIGTLIVNNSLTLTAGGTMRIRISKNGGVVTNDFINGITSLACGGTLAVTNLGAETLIAGDTFQLFSASNTSGSFSVIDLPSLDTGLAWNTNGLAAGLISVVVAVKPQFSTVNQTVDGNFHLTGTGAAGVAYELDAATNLLPPVSWTFVTNAVADQSGYFEFWDSSSTNFLQRFYQIKQAQ